MRAGSSVEERRYGERPDQVLDHHAPDAPRGPVVVAVHGGGWRTGDRGLMRTTAEGLASRGLEVLSIAYRQRPADPVADIVADVEDAVAFARREFPGRPVALLGDSAGGHAALLAGLRDAGRHVVGVVTLCGALDLAALAHPVGAEQEERFAGYRASIAGEGSFEDALARHDPRGLRRRLARGPALFAATSVFDFFEASTLSYVADAVVRGDDVTVHRVGAAHPGCRHSWQLDADLASTTRLFDLVAAWLRGLA